MRQASCANVSLLLSKIFPLLSLFLWVVCHALGAYQWHIITPIIRHSTPTRICLQPARNVAATWAVWPSKEELAGLRETTDKLTPHKFAAACGNFFCSLLQVASQIAVANLWTFSALNGKNCKSPREATTTTSLGGQSRKVFGLR